MKKLIAIVAVAVIAVSAATAQVIIGAKGIFSVGVGTTLEGSIARVFDEYKKSGADVGQKVALGAGGGLYVRYNLPMLSALGFQTELDILANNGIGFKAKGKVEGFPMAIDTDQTSSYTSLELPILVTYDFNVGPVTLTALAGPHLSFPLGKLKSEMKGAGTTKKGEDVIDSKALFGMTFGMAVAYPVGPGSIVGDIRYLNDFSKLRVGEGDFVYDALTRRTLNISLGYQMTF